MMLASVVVCQIEKLFCTPISFAVFAFLFMACTMEVVLLKLTTSAPVFERHNDDWDDGSEYEEDIYYENLENSYEHWARMRMRFRQRQQEQQRQQLLVAQQSQ
ncbi:uncharacterized protein LOC115620900 [Scaptodrosophila lebanonensis]|uniref:Uncharacterized protein LOC115620900 n=1 Tax=Drosophila lebanonensis TaxID=7225 RepID=A0A6J2T5P5_DROLE|nr:uncharacterized protein LOC115620900 [Scaptodrosophila lebanonensis]